MLTFHAILTVVMLMFFIGIVIWAFSDARKADFTAAARMPLDDDETMAPRAGGNPRG